MSEVYRGNYSKEDSGAGYWQFPVDEEKQPGGGGRRAELGLCGVGMMSH